MIYFNDVKKILYESDIDDFPQDDLEDLAGKKIKFDVHITSSKDSESKGNKILRPQGIIIQDTYNNFMFPIRPTPQLDTSRADIIEVYQRYRERYLRFNSDYLPWHFLVEFIGDRYFIFNTRPLDLKYPLNNSEIIEHKDNKFETDIITDFFERRIYQIENMIHICIVGDSNLDIYPSKLYKKISQTCISPIMRQFHILGGVEQRVLNFNLGPKFNIRLITKFAKK